MKQEEKPKINSSLNTAFWFHLFITLLAWLGPILFSWYFMLAAYSIVMVQFQIFGRCLLNRSHDLQDQNDATFYSVVFDLMGITYDATRLKYLVRNWFYPLLALLTILLQLVFNLKPVLF